jgi:hypothetical protein
MAQTALDNVDDDRPSEAGKSRFDNFKNLASGFILGIAAVTMSINNFTEMWRPPTGPMPTAVFWVRIVLFAELVVLVCRWVVATHREFDMWLYWLDNPIQKPEVHGALIGLSVFLGVSVASPHQILFLTAFMSTSFLLFYWTQWLSNDHFARALKRTRELPALTETRRRVLVAMETYWLERAQLARNATMMFFVLIAFAFAFAGSVQSEPRRTLFQLISYAILILVIFGGEVWIIRWRQARDEAIKAATARR